MRKATSLFVIFVIISVAYLQAYAKNEEEKISIVSHIYGLRGDREINVKVSREKAEKILSSLEKLSNAIHNNDAVQMLKISQELEAEGIFTKETTDLVMQRIKFQSIRTTNMNLTNLLCFIWGFGEEGIFIYSLDLLLITGFILFFSMIPLGFLLAFLLSFAWLFVSHLLPFRAINPLIAFSVRGGEMTTAGLMGIQKLGENRDDIIFGVMIGFIGIIVNIIYPISSDKLSPYFCMGYSLSVLTK